MKPSDSDRPESYSAYSGPPSPVSSPARTSEPPKTLLVVDDDEAVRRTLAKILARQGYSVLQAESAEAALRLAHSTRIHLLVTDLSMPEMDGLELTRRIRRVHPETPVLMVSGSLPELRDGGQDFDRFELLAKPFTFRDLLCKVRDLLHSAVPRLEPEPQCRDYLAQ